MALVAFLRPELKFDGAGAAGGADAARRRGGAGAPGRTRGDGVIETDRLILRRWTARDLAPFAALNADPEVMRHFPKPLDPRRERRDGGAHRGPLGGGRHRPRRRPSARATGRSSAWSGWRGCASRRSPAPSRSAGGWRGRTGAQGYATEAARAWLGHGFGAMGLAGDRRLHGAGQPRLAAGDAPDRHAARPGPRLRASVAAGGARAAARTSSTPWRRRAAGEAPVIETARLLLRRWLPRDRAPFAAMNADPAVMDFPRPLTRAESDAEMAGFDGALGRGRLLLGGGRSGESDGAFVGMVGLARCEHGRAVLPLRRDRLAAAAARTGGRATPPRRRGPGSTHGFAVLGLDGDRGLHRSRPRRGRRR